MSYVSKYSRKGKKADKESAKSSSKSLAHLNNSVVQPTSGCNPLLETFHTFEAAPLPYANLHYVNSRFRNIDDSDDHNGSSVGSVIEFDSVSNNGSCSGESEDHKEKAPPPLPTQESVPGAENDKREKIRVKNEKKHLRQKEKRAQELHEKCSSYLMSRKLEALGQQLIAMGFSPERATMALILNEGRVEESVAWLFEEAEDEKHEDLNFDGGGNLKIDISEELARITDIEIKYKASKQEVQRIVVSCEGDLDMAEETLKRQKQEASAASKPEESGDPPTVSSGNLPYDISQNANRIQARPTSTSSSSFQQKRDEKDNYAKAGMMAPSSMDPGSKNMQLLNRTRSKMEWPKAQQIAVPSEKRWAVPGSNTNVSYSLASPLQASPLPAKIEACHVPAGNDLRTLQIGSVREPVIVMQKHTSINPKQTPSSSLNSNPLGAAMGWYPNTVEGVKPNGAVSPVAVTRSLGSNGLPSYSHLHYQTKKHGLSGNESLDSQGTTGGIGLWNRAGQSPAIAPASSLGLFSSQGVNSSSGSISPVNWASGCSTIDYCSIDWSLDQGLLTKTPKEFRADPNYALQSKAETVSYSPDINPTRRPVLSNLNSGAMLGWQDRIGSSDPSVVGSMEWTSPFEGKDLFSLPRLFVSSPLR